MSNDAAALSDSFRATTRRLGIDRGNAAVLYLDAGHAACACEELCSGTRVQVRDRDAR